MGRPIAWVGDPNSPDLTPQVPPSSSTAWCPASVQTLPLTSWSCRF